MKFLYITKSQTSQTLIFTFPSLSPNSSITAVRGRSLKRGKRRNQSLLPCRQPAPWLCQLPLRRQHQITIVMNQRPTLPPSSPRPMGRPVSPQRRHHADASARTPSAHPALDARCPFTCSTQSACAMAAAGSATELFTRRTWNCPWTWPACTTSLISSALVARGGWWTTAASARMCKGAECGACRHAEISRSLYCNTEGCRSWRLKVNICTTIFCKNPEVTLLILDLKNDHFWQLLDNKLVN